MIAVRNITKTIQGKIILENISLDVKRNNCLALIGPSGAGKTTLLRLLAGLEKPDNGCITLGDSVINGPHIAACPGKTNIGMIFQDLALWPHMTVRKHLEFVLQKQYGKKKIVSEKIEELLDLVHLKKNMNCLVHQLSGGEQQRLAIVRALAQNPEYLLMDEPFSNIDPFLKEELETLLIHLKESRNIGLVCITHSLAEFERLIDRIAVIGNGKLLQIGKKKEVLECPSNSFVKKMLRL